MKKKKKNKNKTNIPIQIEKPRVYQRYSNPEAIMVGVLASVFIVLSLGILIFINVHQHDSVVKGASVTYCNVILVGSLCAYASVFTFIERPTTVKCILQPLLLCVAFVMMYW